MKHFNINKLLGAAIILLLLAGCENSISNNRPDEAAENSGLSVTGTISLSGAAPARSATSSFSDSLLWVINAESSNFPDATVTSATKTFTLKFPEAGLYKVTAYGFTGTVDPVTLSQTPPVLMGEVENVQVTENGLSSELVIPVSPVLGNATSAICGSVSLSFTDQTGSIKKVLASFTKFQASSSDLPVKTNGIFVGGQAILTASNLLPGSYIVNFSFEDASGNNLYACKETVTIYPGMTTDTWYGTAPYLTSDNRFVLTSDIINNYPSELVPSSRYVLYNNSYGTWGPETNLYLADGNNMNSINTPDIEIQSTSGNSWDWGGSTFDSEGNIYSLAYKEANGANAYKIYRNGIVIADSADYAGNTMYYEAISCDIADNDTFYLGVYSSSQIIKKFEKADLTVDNLSNTNYPNIQPELSSNGKPYKFAVHDGIIYYAHDARSNSDKPQLRTINYSSGAVSSATVLDFDSDVSINDVIYQDGNVYILVSQSKSELGVNKSDLISRGAVLKYNILTKTLDTKKLGWTNTEQDKTNKWVTAAYLNNGDVRGLLYTSSNHTVRVIAKADLLSPFSIYCPETEEGGLSATGLYGPKRFIAIKPKKLVIADEGIAYYTDALGVYKAKNVNRIVTVDLESFAIAESYSVPSSIKFNEDADKIGYCSFGSWENTDLVLYDENKNVLLDSVNDPKTIELYSTMNGNPVDVTLDGTQFNWFTKTALAMEFDSE